VVILRVLVIYLICVRLKSPSHSTLTAHASNLKL